MWRHIFTRIGLVGLVILALASCEAVNDLLGIDDDDDGELPANLQITDWSQSRYDEIGRVTGSRSISVPSRYAGADLLYIATNSGSSSANVSVPFASVQGSISSASTPDAYEPPTDPAFRAIAGFPGQFDNLPSLRRGAPAVVSSSSISSSATIGTTQIFSTENPINPTIDSNVNATLVVQQSDGTWTVNIWLTNGDADAENTSVTITADMLQFVADQFLRSGGDNDIFDWVTPVFGDPWGPHPFSNQINQNSRDIHILFYDIDGDGLDGTDGAFVVGYYRPLDNFTDEPESNQRLMFYMDSALFADGTTDGVSWNITDAGPAIISSTLAHEFQHMIQFYQRVVRGGLQSEYSTWLNETSSEVTEDLVSRRLGTPGPRGVDAFDGTAGSAANIAGRLPLYNAAGRVTSLTEWNNDLIDYSAVYAFGAFLLRTFGAELFHILLTETPTGSDDVDAYTISSLTGAASRIAGQTMRMEELLRRWGVAVAVSDDSGVPAGYRLNRNGFITTSGNGATYDVGSIDAYRYRFRFNDGFILDGPAWFRTDSGPVEVQGTANVFLYAGVVPQGGVNLDFSLPSGVEITVLTWD